MPLSKRENSAIEILARRKERLFRNCLGDNIHRTGVCTDTGGAAGSLSSQSWANSDPGLPPAPYVGGSQTTG